MKFSYNNENIISEYDNGGVLQAKYTQGLEIDNPISKTTNGQTYFYHSNHQGSITELTGQAQTIANSYQYDAYGNTINQTGNVLNPYTYTGREYDSETGLYYYRARYYDAGVGRFVSEDPILFPYYYEGKFRYFFYALKNSPQILNKYLYCNNSPIDQIDPYGLFNWKKFLKCASCYATFTAETTWAVFGMGCPNPQDIKDALTRLRTCKAKYCSGGFDDDDDDDDEYTPGTFYPPVPVPNPGKFYPPVPVGQPYSNY